MTNKLREVAQQALEFMDELLPPTNEIDPSRLSDPTVLRDVQKRDALRAALMSGTDGVGPEKQGDGWVLREVLFDNGEPIAHREPTALQENPNDA